MYKRLTINRLLIFLSPIGIFLGVIAYLASSISVHSQWRYEVVHENLPLVSGLAQSGDTLFITLEQRHQRGKIISITNSDRKVLLDSLNSPDGLAIYKQRLIYTQESGPRPIYEFDGVKHTPLFVADNAEGIDVAENGDIYVIEDRASGRILKYARETGDVSVLVTDLDEAEGICIMNTGDIYYVLKSDTVLYRLRDGISTPVQSGFNKPAYVYCDKEEDGLWITEDRHNLGRLLHYDLDGSLLVIASRLKAPQSILPTPDGSILLAEQGRNRILSFKRQGTPESGQ